MSSPDADSQNSKAFRGQTQLIHAFGFERRLKGKPLTNFRVTSIRQINVKKTLAPFAALFDWDGVILDSSAQHEESWELLAKERGLPLFEGHFKLGFGMKNEAIIPHLLKWSLDIQEILELSLRKEEFFREILIKKGLQPLPGVIAFLDQLRSGEIPCVIGSSTHRLNIETCLAVLGLSDRFVGIISAENVSRGKPDPEVFQMAAKMVGHEPSNCIVFEDAQVGIDAALSGGMKVVAVTTTHAAEKLRGAHRTVHRLDSLTQEDLMQLVQER